MNVAIEAAQYENLHITDIDMIYNSTQFLDDASALKNSALFPIIAKEQTPSGLSLYMECHGYGIASMTKTIFNKAGGFEDLREWGFEDTKLFNAVDELLGIDNIKRTMYHDAIHQWHSVKPNVKPATK